MIISIKTDRIDLHDFLKGIAEAESEVEISDVVDLVPESFQDELWEFLGDLDSDISLDELKIMIRKKSVELVWHIAQETNKTNFNFQEWLSADIPLLPTFITNPLCDEYRSCSMIYANFEDCYSGFDGKSFRDDALRKIKVYLDTFLKK